MSLDLLHPPPRLPPHRTLQLSQQAPRVLQTSPFGSLPWPLSLLTSNETQETWTIHENLLLSCLRTGDDQSARQCLDRLTQRFGADNQRIMAFRGMYDAAIAKDNKELEALLKRHEEALKEDPTNLPIRKQKVTVLKSLSRPNEAIAALVELLDFSPTDAESWAELSDLYHSQKLYSQAIFALEEVLLITPFAWNVHARMGELLYVSATAAGSNVDGNLFKALSESMRRFCRSIELCDNYLRGYYGLKLTTKRLLELLPAAPSKPPTAVADPTFGDLAPPPVATVQRLHELATSKLAEIVRRSNAGEAGWDYEQAEVISARELLDRDVESVPK